MNDLDAAEQPEVLDDDEFGARLRDLSRAPLLAPEPVASISRAVVLSSRVERRFCEVCRSEIARDQAGTVTALQQIGGGVGTKSVDGLPRPFYELCWPDHQGRYRSVQGIW